MANYIAGLVPSAPALVAGRHVAHRRRFYGYVPPSGATTTTYYYRTSGGARGSTTDAGSIPAGAVVERVT